MLGQSDPWSLALFVFVLLATGMIAGTIAGLLGVGGGIVIVPVLFHFSDLLGIDEAVRMHLAVGTSLATIIPTSIASAGAHMRKGSVDMRLLKEWGAGILAGVLVGSAIAGFVDGTVLTAVFAVMALSVSVNMALRTDDTALWRTLPTGLARLSIASFIGGLSTMMGIGGGTLSVPVLSAFNYPIHKAIGTAAAIGLIIGVPGTIGFLIGGLDVPGRPIGSVGYVNLIGVALIAPTSILFAPYGAALAHRTDPRGLKKLFAVFLFLTALRMGYGLLLA